MSQLVKLIIHICFKFFIYKNYIMGVDIPTASQVSYIYVFLLLCS